MDSLKERAYAYNREIKEALTTVYAALNTGQKQKLVKDEKVKALFEKYGVEAKTKIREEYPDDGGTV